MEALQQEAPPQRVCENCNKQITEGYCIDGGVEYFCSKQCLNTHYTDEEWAEMYDNGNSESYYTTWDKDE